MAITSTIGTSNPNLPAGSILPGSGVANGSGGYTPIAPGQPGSTVNTTGPVPTPSTGSQPSAPNTSGTTLSNANIIENTIPNLNAKASSLTAAAPTTLTPTPPAAQPNPAAPTDPSQSTDYTTLYNSALAAQPDVTSDPQYQQDMDLINSMQSSNDATSNAYVNSIQQNYAGLTTTLQNQQASTDAKTENALLLGGSSRYAPVSSGGILDLQTRSDLNALATLQDQENQKIAEVKQAQNTQDYNLMNEKMKELDTLTANKQKLAQTIATNMQKTNQTAQTAQVQNQQDNAIAELVKAGTTDPDEILAALTKQGFTTATAKSVATTLEGIQKSTGTKSLTALSGNIGAFYTLQAAGQLPADISSLPAGQQLMAFLKADKAATTTAKATKASSSSSTSGKTYTDGSLTVTPADQAADTQYLKSKEGTDGYVDPDVFQTAYNTWIQKGGTVSGFLKAFPPKDYVNPANTALPAYLRSSTKSSTSSKSTTTATASSADPFG